LHLYVLISNEIDKKNATVREHGLKTSFTTKANQNHIPTTFMMPCEVNKDCHDAVTAEYIEYLKSYLEQVICMNGICRIIPL
jgi:hypothetical protein